MVSTLLMQEDLLGGYVYKWVIEGYSRKNLDIEDIHSLLLGVARMGNLKPLSPPATLNWNEDTAAALLSLPVTGSGHIYFNQSSKIPIFGRTISIQICTEGQFDGELAAAFIINELRLRRAKISKWTENAMNAQ